MRQLICRYGIFKRGERRKWIRGRLFGDNLAAASVAAAKFCSYVLKRLLIAGFILPAAIWNK
ncbi:hypothetical protein ASZ90_017173 [hydrocarbon metagenome]|uniref:Uncharacterized protein n=1 Tax=hydrocarbon metagenome TaxID=938273 RepID=A0A0W8E9V8_9ZZZZ